MTSTHPSFLSPSFLSRRSLLAASLLLPVAAGLAGCSTGPAQARSALDRVPAADPGDRARSGADFAVNLVRGLLSGPDNLVVSPLSIQLALSMVRNGAAGQTAAEFDQLLDIGDLSTYNSELNSLTQLIESRAVTRDDESQVEIKLANALWGQDGLAWSEPFLDTLAQYYGAGVNLVDFADPAPAVTAINEWTDEQTAGRIPEIVTAELVTEWTRMVLVNAVGITANWRRPLIQLPDPAPFTTGGGDQVETAMLATTTESWWSDDVCEATRIACVGDDLALAVVRPRTTVADVLDHWADGGLAALLSGWQKAKVELTLPAWQQDWRGSLIDVLTSLGMTTAFTEHADFSAMTADEDLLIAFVEHRATLSIDRHGLSAAAATAIGMEPTSAQVPELTAELTLDRDFLHVLHDRSTETVLFLGIVDDPR